MSILITLLTVLDVLIALLIIALVLVQQSKKGGGLGTTFGGGGADSLFGAHASSHLSKLTVIFASLFLIITLALAVITAHAPRQKSLGEINSILANTQTQQQSQTKASLPEATKKAPAATQKTKKKAN